MGGIGRRSQMLPICSFIFIYASVWSRPFSAWSHQIRTPECVQEAFVVRLDCAVQFMCVFGKKRALHLKQPGTVASSMKSGTSQFLLALPQSPDSESKRSGGLEGATTIASYPSTFRGVLCSSSLLDVSELLSLPPLPPPLSSPLARAADEDNSATADATAPDGVATYPRDKGSHIGTISILTSYKSISNIML